MRQYHGVIPKARPYANQSRHWKYDHYGRPTPPWWHRWARWRQAMLDRQKRRIIDNLG